jgi:tRNA G18 (ribose-2'-O)-methylase SpoU
VFVAESRLVVRCLLTAGRFPVRSVLLTETALESLRDVLAPADQVLVAPDALIQGVVGFDFHGGCLAIGERGAEPPLAELLAARLLVVLEGVTSPDNVGGVFRNACAFGADGVVLGPRCADPLYRRAIRVSMGASLAIPFTHATDWPDALGRLRAAGFTVIGLTPRAPAVDIGEFGGRRAIPERVALLLGGEEAGLSAAASAAADLRVLIPMVPGVDSLNAATACGIALHRFSSLAVPAARR